MSTIRSTRRSFTISAGTAAALLGAFRTLPGSVVAQETEFPELALVATEFHFDMPASADAGFNRITLENKGAVDHHAMFVRINDDATPDDFLAALQSGDFAAITEITTVYGGPGTGPGGTGTVIVNLDSGTYFVVCVIPDDEGAPHAAHGMVSPLEVSTTVVDTEEPIADTEIELADMMFVGLPESVPVGEHLWKVTNKGPQIHEIVILKLGEGLTVEDFAAMMSSPPPAGTPGAAPAGPPPFSFAAGTAALSVDMVNYLEFPAEVGNHVALCFVPDATTGAPHFSMGMLAGFEVK